MEKIESSFEKGVFFVFFSLFTFFRLVVGNKAQRIEANKTLFFLHHPRSLSLFPTSQATQESLWLPSERLQEQKSK